MLIVDEATARGALGVGPTASPEELREAWRSRVRTAHPDRAGDTAAATADATAATAQLNAAYVLLRGLHRRDSSPTSGSGAPAGAAGTDTSERPPAAARAPYATSAYVEAWAQDDTVVVALPPPETWSALVDAADTFGEIAYVDSSAGLIEVIVEFTDWPVCSLVFSLQGRATGTTEAFFTVAALDGRPTPPVEAVARFLADRIAEQVAR